ncbi:flagellar basal body P-ring formation chaperone FlgA [Acanthopleuribacter pedis]|uniref:Flagellar basal body P-ring formation protein FlgA n=1 Tax=Acanthopleuribacter pedis TaxID=442870 RepID=A0A8J7U3G6_9BACT|nr:flagellar basal body P-ring formation chaperone FlgA [Acanthopleuribacter pedis]MBO1320388.1 flagellar basal body P-ring formation protein FlgA [Acanthopleuribacter pedis]
MMTLMGFCMLLWANAENNVLSLALRQEVTVNAEKVTLSDVLQSDSYQRVKQMGFKNYPITSAPPIQGKRVLRTFQVEQILRVNGYRGNYQWQGARSVLVSRAGRDFSPANLEEAVRHWIEQQSSPENDYRMERIVTPRIGKVPPGKLTYNIRKRGNRGLVGRNSLSVDLRVNDRVFRTVLVQTTISVERLVATLNRDMERGQIIGEDDVTWDYRRLDHINAPLVTPEQFSQISARTMIRAGSVLTKHQVAITPLVIRNQPTRVTARNGSLKVRMKAMAMDNGSAGDHVRLKNLQTGKIFVGLVNADGSVVVELTP